MKAILPSQRACRGFGSIELVLAVIILGMVFLFTLKGTALVAPMRAFIVAQQINGYKAAMMHYQEEFRAVPGDDPAAPGRWGRAPSLYTLNAQAVSQAGDGRINGLLDDTANATGEQFFAWSDLRNGGFIAGDAELVGQSARPDNVYGGIYGFAEDNFGLQQVLCLTKVPGTDAALLDKRLDDGVISTGRVRATSKSDPVGAMNHFPQPDTAAYDPEKTYIICMPYEP